MDSHLNKRNIKERMNKIASGYSDINRSESIDPVVVLFLESFAEEICRVGGEIDNMENRVSDKLSQLLVPDSDIIGKPAHALIHVPATEPVLPITTGNEFACFEQKNGKELFFYPVCNTRVWNGDIRYFIHHDRFYSIDKYQNKRPLTHHAKEGYFHENSFWLGLSLDTAVENLFGLSFYVDMPGVQNKKEYLKQLLCSRWTIQGEILPTTQGLFSIEEEYESDALKLYHEYNFSNRINRSIKNDYDIHFLTVTGDFSPKNKQEFFPEKLKKAFHSTDIDGFTDPLLWIEVVCPPDFTAEMIDSIKICINTLPVVNKKLVSKTIEINKFIPLIPLKTDRNESFISIFSLTDSTGKRYYDIPINDLSGHFGIYSLSQGGFERYNNRDAEAYLESLVHLLDREVSAFFNNRNDLKNDLKIMEQDVNELIRHLKKVISEKKSALEIGNYIHIHQENENEIYFVEYWVNQGVDAGQVNEGTILYSTSGLPVQQAVVLENQLRIRN
jgi:hypothetical protein